CSGGSSPRRRPEAVIPDAAKRLGDSPASFAAAARAIMTTDTFPKTDTRALELGGTAIRVSGVAKGAAMIAPNMATMLAVILTDAALSPAEADALLRHA